MAYRVIPVSKGVGGGEDDPRITVEGGGDDDLVLKVVYRIHFENEPSPRFAEVIFSGVTEFHVRLEELSWPLFNEKDFETYLIEIIDSHVLKIVRDVIPAYRIVDLKHFRLSFLKFGTIDILATEVSSRTLD